MTVPVGAGSETTLAFTPQKEETMTDKPTIAWCTASGTERAIWGKAVLELGSTRIISRFTPSNCR
ncbi:hypothetical protein L905_07500 [Agrobacterium sp. TS43]|nr:hypothetical protein L905_07500 [Agrobacterium sp. TS43]KVK67568.1 hypothetical protein L907_18265 [Agrobacterium sp. C13]